MAKRTMNIQFKNATISLSNNEIVEYTKDDVKTYVLSDVLKQFEGENKFVDITIKEASELEPSEVEGE